MTATDFRAAGVDLERQWPASIRESIQDRLGPQPEVHPLGGMGGSAVVRLQGRGQSAVLKRSPSSVELHVYTTMSEPLLAAGVGMPDLYASSQSEGTFWLLLEDIPHPFPRDRWEADDEQLAMLRRLHELNPDTMNLPADAYKPSWSDELTASALSLFDLDVADTLSGKLRNVRDQTRQLFEPTRLISGDPNPVNWGLRDDGSLVLYDWEHCTRASPAIDLAITVPGLGNPATFQQVAAVQGGPDRLTADIARAKIWAVIEFLAGYSQGQTVPTFSLDPLLEQTPAWLQRLTSSMR